MVDIVNPRLFHKFFSPNSRIDLPITYQADGEIDFQIKLWLEDKDFIEIEQVRCIIYRCLLLMTHYETFITYPIKVAIGCRVMITNNIHLAKGVVNGATGIVEGLLLRESDPSEIMTVLVRLDGTKELVRVTRTKFARFYRGNDFFLKRTFPMRLAYGITGEFKHFNS